MINFKLYRDEARLFEETFLPYMIRVARTKVAGAAAGEVDNLTGRVLLSLLLEVKRVFDRKLLTRANRFSFSFNDAEGIAFYMFLMKQPIDQVNVYALKTRQKVCDDIHKQLLQPFKHNN